MDDKNLYPAMIGKLREMLATQGFALGQTDVGNHGQSRSSDSQQTSSESLDGIRGTGTWAKLRHVYANAPSRSRDPRPGANRHTERRSSRAFGSPRRARPGSGASTPIYPGSAWTCMHAHH